MVFTTHLFLFYFLPVVLATYYLLPFRARTAWIAFSSYVFYGWANPLWAVLMFLNSGVDYVCGLVLLRLSGQKTYGDDGLPSVLPRGGTRSRGQKLALAVSMTSNLSLLAFFKYYGFVTENLNAISESLGYGLSLVPALEIALPVGISFYTFKSMSYAIDVYLGDARPMVSFIDYCCFEAFFPDLVAGPIVRYGAIEQQMRSRTHTPEKFARGVSFFAVGMAKKILIANPLAGVADAAFAADSLHWYDAWYGVVAYALQIYFDFSGYSDMACGLALMMGFVLIKNFNSPYKADGITDFWRRWHISLSTWLRDYLYIPLGGNRRGEVRTYANLMLVMLVGGFWHGASWNFLIWGAIHGGMLAFERAQGKNSPYRALPRAVRVLITFGVVCVTWVFFRAATLPAAVGYLRCMFGDADAGAAADATTAQLYGLYPTFCFALGCLLVWFAPNSWVVTRRLTPLRVIGFAAMLTAAVLMMWTQTDNPFIYFQF